MPNLLRQFFKFAVPAAATVLLASCGGQSKSEPDKPPFTDVYASFDTACINCHSPGGSAYGGATGMALDFSTKALAYQTLLAFNVSATSNAANCAGVKIVSAGSAANSYLAGILISSYAQPNFAGKTGCTPSYTTHSGNTLTLTAKDKTRIESWLNAGALNN